MVRERYVFNLAPSIPGNHGRGDIIETLAAAGAQVDDARPVGVIQKPEIHIHHIIDIDKVTTLLAITVAITARQTGADFLRPRVAG